MSNATTTPDKSRRRDPGNTILLLAILVGLLMGLASFLLHKLVDGVRNVGWRLLDAAQTDAAHHLVLILLPLCGLLLSFLVQKHLCGPNFAKSLSPLILALDRRQETVPKRDMLTHILSASLCVGFGGSAGLEAPSVLTGAAIGSNLARAFHIDRLPRSLLVGCGAAAAISAIFDSPVAGVLFVVEALLPEFSVAALVPLLLSSAVSSVVSQTLTGHQVFFMADFAPWNRINLWTMFLCGAVCALSGVLVIRSTAWLGGRLRAWLPDERARLLGGGLALCLLLYAFPHLKGQGYESIEALLLNDSSFLNEPPAFLEQAHGLPLTLAMLLAALFLKSFVSSLTIESGGDGGIFAPTMFIGAFTGYAFARLINLSGLATIPESNFTALGMCGVFTAVMRAPMTGVFLIAETTGAYRLLVPLMIVSAIAWALGKVFEPNSIYRRSLVADKLVSDDHDATVLRRIGVWSAITPVPLYVMPDLRLSEMMELVENTQIEAPTYPVIDGEERLVGMLPAEKFLTSLLNHSAAITVEEMMDPPLGTLNPEDNLATALERMEEHHLNALPVVSREGAHFLGIVTKDNLFEKYRGEEQ